VGTYLVAPQNEAPELATKPPRRKPGLSLEFPCLRSLTREVMG
jgi:hypothetical protein